MVVFLNNTQLKELKKINTEVNKSMFYQEDKKTYGKIDYWIPSATVGDCEDAALSKMWRLMNIGFDRKELRLAVCWVVPGDKTTGHCVLSIDAVLPGKKNPKEDDASTLILDINFKDVIRWDKTGYEWYARELPGTSSWELIGTGKTIKRDGS